MTLRRLPLLAEPPLQGMPPPYILLLFHRDPYPHSNHIVQDCHIRNRFPQQFPLDPRSHTLLENHRRLHRLHVFIQLAKCQPHHFPHLGCPASPYMFSCLVFPARRASRDLSGLLLCQTIHKLPLLVSRIHPPVHHFYHSDPKVHPLRPRRRSNCIPVIFFKSVVRPPVFLLQVSSKLPPVVCIRQPLPHPLCHPTPAYHH